VKVTVTEQTPPLPVPVAGSSPLLEYATLPQSADVDPAWTAKSAPSVPPTVKVSGPVGSRELPALGGLVRVTVCAVLVVSTALFPKLNAPELRLMRGGFMPVQLTSTETVSVASVADCTVNPTFGFAPGFVGLTLATRLQDAPANSGAPSQVDETKIS
jgi:hypothetical protein